MEEYKLTTTDYNDISLLIKITKNIYLYYQKLYELEIYNKKDTKEYIDIINKITFLRKEEEKYYNLDFTKCMSYINFLNNTLVGENTNTDTTYNITNLNYTKEYLIRILSTYNNRIINSKHITKLIPLELEDLIQDKELQKMLKDGMMIKNSITNDNYNIFMYFLEEEINNKENKHLKDKLIKLKYYASYINRDIEKGQLSNSFNNAELYLGSKFIKDLYKLDDAMYQDLTKDNNLSLAVSQLRELVKISDIEYLDDNTNISAIARCCFLRSAFINLDNDIIIALNDNFHNIIENNIHLILHNDDVISEKLIINAFNMIKEDREKPKTLSLNK